MGSSTSFWSAAIASVTSTALFYPLEMVETRMQTDSIELADAHKPKPKTMGLWGSIKSVIRNEGYSALYYGLVSCLLGSAVNCGLYFMFYDYLQQNVWQTEQANQPLYQILSGMMSNGIACMISNPFFVVKVRLICNPSHYWWPELRQDETRRSVFISSLISLLVWNNGFLMTCYAIWLMIEEEGLLSLWNGVSASLFGTTEWGLQIMIYKQLKRRFINEQALLEVGGERPDEWNINLLYFLIGAIAKAVALTITFPYQVIRTKMQQQVGGEAPIQEGNNFGEQREGRSKAKTPATRSFLSVAKLIYYESGWKGFTVGIIPNLMRQVPPAGLMFFLIEFIKQTIFSS